MKVILTERVKTLGNVGEVVNVSPGYARNYLLPKSVAVVADESNRRALENEKRRLAKKIAEEKSAAEKLKSKFDGTTLELTKKVGTNGRLFGTVTTNEISKELSKKGVEVERRLIVIPTAIKAIGEFEVNAKLFADVTASFKVKVVLDPKQAEELKKKQELAEKRAKARKEKEAEAAKNADAEEATAEETTEENA